MQNGFTLVEVVIAMTLLAIVSLGLSQALLEGQQHARILEEDRVIHAACQEVIMELPGRNWGPAATPGTIEYMRVNSPLILDLTEFPGEAGTITVTDVSTAYAEKGKAGSVYKIEVRFRHHSFVTYVDNVN